MSKEKERISKLITDSVVEVDVIISKNRGLLKSDKGFFHYIRNTLIKLRDNTESLENLDNSLLKEVENVMTMCARGLEDTPLTKNMNEVAEYLMKYGLYADLQDLFNELDRE